MPEVKRLGTRIAIIVEFNCEVFVGSRSEPRRTGLTCDAPLALRRKEPLRKAGATSPIGRFIPLNPRDGAEVAFRKKPQPRTERMDGHPCHSCKIQRTEKRGALCGAGAAVLGCVYSVRGSWCSGLSHVSLAEEGVREALKPSGEPRGKTLNVGHKKWYELR